MSPVPETGCVKKKCPTVPNPDQADTNEEGFRVHHSSPAAKVLDVVKAGDWEVVKIMVMPFLYDAANKN